MILRKNTLYIILIILAVLLLIKGVDLYNKTAKVTSYSIENVKTKLENFGTGELKDNIVIRKTVAIDNKIVVLFTMGDILGESELTKKIGNRHKVDYTGHGNIFIYRIIETNKGKYLIIRGRNFDNKIDYLKGVVEGKEYKINVPKQDYFIVYCAVPQETKSDFPEDFKLYDDENNDITTESYKKYQ